MTDERSLREIRQEARSFQEEIEASVAELAASNRTLRDVLIDYGKQGYELRIEAGGRSLVGQIEHVGASILRLRTSEGKKVDISTDALTGIRQMSAVLRSGAVTTGHPGTMIARLRESVQTEESVHVERVTGEAIDGRVVAVLDSAIEIETAGAQWLVPIDAVVWVWRT